MASNQHHEEHGHDHDDVHVTRSEYVTGFILAVILTVIPFGLVMGSVIENRATAALILGVLAAVHLHMNGKMQGGWTLLSTLFTIIFVAVTLAGTLWVMFHMNDNMMPSHGSPSIGISR